MGRGSGWQPLWTCWGAPAVDGSLAKNSWRSALGRIVAAAPVARSWTTAAVPPLEHGGSVIDHPPTSTLKWWSDPLATPTANGRHMDAAELRHGELWQQHPIPTLSWHRGAPSRATAGSTDRFAASSERPSDRCVSQERFALTYYERQGRRDVLVPASWWAPGQALKLLCLVKLRGGSRRRAGHSIRGV